MLKNKRPLQPAWTRDAALMAKLGGLTHDWGKLLQFFQDKLHKQETIKLMDPVRHEWASLVMLQAFRKDMTTEAATHAWNKISKSPVKRKASPNFFAAFNDWTDCLDYIVSTHHKVYESTKNILETGNHVRDPAPHVRDVSPIDFKLAADVPASVIKKTIAALQKMDAAANRLPAEVDKHLYWRAIGMISRAGLVLGDHHISSLVPTNVRSRDGMYANTHGGKPCQPLEWHLHNVSRAAEQVTSEMTRMVLPGLSAKAVTEIMKQAPANSRFSWQDEAVKALSRNRKIPSLVINLAGTGAGKTRMNAKAVCALNKHKPVRFSTALNLRTLTLQTGDSYKNELNIGVNELATVIGDNMVHKLHKFTTQHDDVDGNPEEADLDVINGHEIPALPEWLVKTVEHKSGAQRVLAPPVLVSTIDTLIRAGEPGHQGHHAVQMLRLATSDLVLDELDSYDPDAFMAVLRLVIVSGLFSRNVIASSATLPKPMVKSLIDAFHYGLMLRESLEWRAAHRVRFRVVYIDNITTPTSHTYKGACRDLLWDKAGRHFDAKILAMQNAFLASRFKVPELQRFTRSKGASGLLEATQRATLRLHQRHGWKYNKTGKRVSFGLVRIANIKMAIPLARFLAEHNITAHVASYHSQDLMIQRYHKERRLDFLLNRKAGNLNIEGDPEINQLVLDSEHTDVMFIVVATPVEEVGRDHDFDYAVIEPSSTHSIIQTAGRVNRHREVSVEKPNIVILQYNAREVSKRANDRLSFNRPGLESESFIYPSHDLSLLLDWKNLHNLNAGMRYDADSHSFSRLDDKAITLRVHSADSSSMKLINHKTLWMGNYCYDSARLRDSDKNVTYCVDEMENIFKVTLVKGVAKLVPTHIYGIHQSIERAWLDLTVLDMAALARSAKIHLEKALSVRIPEYKDDNDTVITDVLWDKSFGWRNM